jgi:hypothetical protein
MVAIYRFIDDLNEGKSPRPIQLRDGDPYKELVDKLNQLAKK